MPGSWPWLLGHELRLTWRGVGGTNSRGALALAGLLWLLAHVALAMLVHSTGWARMTPGLFVLLGVLVWFFITLLLSQAILQAVGALFERGDLDLLLASPIAPRSVLFVRGVGVAISAIAIYAWLLTPVADVGLFTGQAQLLAIYPALLANALLATALALAITVALVGVLGARGARVAAQVLGALVGAGMFLATQASRFVAPGRFGEWLVTWYLEASRRGSLVRDQLLWLPARALLGEPFALVLLGVLGVAAFASVVAVLERRFLAGTQETMTAPWRPRQTTAPTRFRGGLWRTVLVKEWKLIARDPRLMANTLLQVIYMLPIAFLWLRNDSPRSALAPAMVLLASTLASGLVWLTVAAEDAPELLASAPADRGLLRRAKLVAGLVPVWLLMLPLALALARSDAGAAAVFIVCIGGATACAASIHIALPRRGRRRDLLRRGKGNVAAALFELATIAGWTTTTWLLLEAPWLAPLGALVALGVPLLAWRWGRQRRSEFSAA